MDWQFRSLECGGKRSASPLWIGGGIVLKRSKAPPPLRSPAHSMDWQFRSLECGGKRNATPLWIGGGIVLKRSKAPPSLRAAGALHGLAISLPGVRRQAQRDSALDWRRYRIEEIQSAATATLCRRTPKIGLFAPWSAEASAARLRFGLAAVSY